VPYHGPGSLGEGPVHCGTHGHAGWASDLAPIADRWTPVVLYSLCVREVRRFNAPASDPGRLQEDADADPAPPGARWAGASHRIYEEVPPKTKYRLTEDGRRLSEPIAQLCAWGLRNRPSSPSSSPVATWPELADYGCVTTKRQLRFH
jgi:DNA-binding HxlR family transcriptional regulator